MAIASAGLAIVFAGAMLPTPLYPIYRRVFGFSSVTLTLIYAVYVLGNLAALFAFGRLRLVYLAYIVVLLAIGLATVPARETVVNSAGDWTETFPRPRLGVPREIRARFISPAATAFATFALLGFYGALIPNLLAESMHQSGHAIAGAVVFELFLAATAAAVLAARLSSRSAMLGGLALLLPCLALLVLSQSVQGMAVLLLATALGGIAAALGYRGSLEVVNQIAPADRRSEVVSSYLVAVYLGNSLPVIGIGLLSSVTGSFIAHLVFAVVIAIIAVAAVATGLAYAAVR